MGDLAEEFKEEALDIVSNWANGNGSVNHELDEAKHLIPDDPFFDDDDDDAPVGDGHPCKAILYKTLSSGSSVRLWDLLILIPCATFLCFLLIRLPNARMKLQNSSSLVSCLFENVAVVGVLVVTVFILVLQIFRAFYFLIWVSTVVGVTRCLVSMVIGIGSSAAGDTADRLLWLLLRFCLLATEMSVLVFGVAGAQLDSRKSIRRVVLVAAIGSFAFSTAQAVLEFSYHDPNFYVAKRQLSLFSHGGMVFWLVGSVVFTSVYLVILLLPLLPCKHHFSLPHKTSFYKYVAFLLMVDVTQLFGALGSVCGLADGLCFVNMASFIYFTAFIPIVYFTFLSGFFSSAAQPTLLFSYKAQVNRDV